MLVEFKGKKYMTTSVRATYDRESNVYTARAYDVDEKPDEDGWVTCYLIIWDAHRYLEAYGFITELGEPLAVDPLCGYHKETGMCC